MLELNDHQCGAIVVSREDWPAQVCLCPTVCLYQLKRFAHEHDHSNNYPYR
jgi:hypothetical protein